MNASHDMVEVHCSFRWKFISRSVSRSDASFDHQNLGFSFFGHKIDGLFFLNVL